MSQLYLHLHQSNQYHKPQRCYLLYSIIYFKVKTFYLLWIAFKDISGNDAYNVCDSYDRILEVLTPIES